MNKKPSREAQRLGNERITMSSDAPVIPTGSEHGRPIPINATSSPGTTLHTCTTSPEHADEVEIYVSNESTALVSVTLEIHGTGAQFEVTDSIYPKSGLNLIYTGVRLNGGSVIKAFAGAANACNAHLAVRRARLSEISE